MGTNFIVGSKYTVQFWDHCLGQFKILCEVTIYITSQDKTHLYGTWWRVITKEESIEESNREMISIVKSTIVKTKKLSRI